MLAIENILTLSVHAETPVVKTEGGQIVFTVRDKTATTGIRFKTVGFTLTKGECKPSGGDPRKQEYGILYIDNPYCSKESIPQGDGTTVTTFTFKK